MVVYDHDLLAHPYRTVVDFADAYTAHVFVIIYGTDKDLRRGIGITHRRWDVVYYRIQQRL